jgi:Amt family ammonium transporter
MSYEGNVGSQFNFTTTNWLDTGDNSWQLTAATLVGLQSVPGLVVLYVLREDFCLIHLLINI